MSERFPLEATSRTTIGKKVSQLRVQGQVPAVIYGPKFEPVHISIEWPKLRPVLLEAGGTHLVDVNVDGTTIPTLIRSVQRHHTQKDVVLHVDFYAVNMSETIVTSIPLVVVNDEETARAIAGQIIVEQAMIDVESLPNNIPTEIVIDILPIIKEIGQHVHVTDLPKLDGVTYLIDEDVPLIRSDYRSDTSADESDESVDMAVEPERITRRKEEDFDE